MAASGAFRLWASVFAIAALPPLLALWTDLPTTPLPADAPPTEFSEARAMPIVEELAGTIGHRLAGTEGARRGEEYLVARLREIPGLEVEVQDADGVTGGVTRLSRFRVRNVLARLPGDESTAVLVSAHYDSALGSVGAADDAVGVAAAIEIARALAAGPKLRHTVVFNLNEGEELGLYGSLAFLEHHWADDLRAFVNLEAAGAGGRPMLFQATSARLVSAYARGAPHPHGSVFAQDVFDSGIIPSDTDYRIYRNAGRLPGLDLALYQDGWAYHTHLDRPERVEPGGLQEMGANTLGAVRELAGGALPEGLDEQPTVFYDLLGSVLVRYSRGMANALAALALVVFVFAVATGVRRRRLSLPAVLLGLGTNLLMFTSVLVPALAMAWLVSGPLERPFGWYSRPWLGVVAFGAPTIGAALVAHGVAAAPTSGREPLGDAARPMLLSGQLLGWAVALVLLTGMGLGSAYIALWWLLPGAIGLRIAITHPERPLLALAIAYLPGALVTSQLAVALVSAFVPMAGRMHNPMFDFAIAMLVALPVAVCGLAAAAALHHTASRYWRPLGAVFCALGLVAAAYMAIVDPYTEERPRRLELQIADGNGRRALAVWSLDGLPLGDSLTGISGARLADAQHIEDSDLPVPAAATLEVLDSSLSDDGGVRMRIRLQPRGAYYVSVRLPEDVDVVWENADHLRGSKVRDLAFVAPPTEGVEFTLALPERRDLDVFVVTQHAELPDEVHALIEELPRSVAVEATVRIRRKVTLSPR